MYIAKHIDATWCVMICSIDGCKNKMMYTGKKLCQMHYFRFMRNKTFDTVRTRNYRSRNAKGYQLIYEPEHQLAHSNGYVYEHRFVYFNNIDRNPKSCEMCGKSIDWSTLHIDHIDNDITNNKPSNLRAACRGCNTFRGHTLTSMVKDAVTIGDVSMSAERWAKNPDVNVCGASIRRRIKSGMSHYDAVYSSKVTHKKNKPADHRALQSKN